ncbi:MAG: 1-acyl-sn-glycerol-3-phosphate acyltransferase [Vallitaleaceae bacterium]|nr:1-acyl-sn-glycerol-3-phosphate acyltransferase [Vallitaleaceae bacterium]
MRTVITFATFGAYLLVSLIFEIKYKILGRRGKIKEQEAYLHKVTRNWAQIMIKSTGSTVDVLGIENLPERNVLFVGNHQGYGDIPLMLGYIPNLKGLVAKVELQKVPIMNRWMTRLGCLFLDRSSLRQSMEMILKGIEMLKNGKNLVVFPEGTRSKGNTVGEFKKGSLQLAVKSGAPVVPITINGSYKIYEETGKIRKAAMKIIIHPAIYMDDLSTDEKKNLAEIVKKIIEAPLL